MHDHVEGKGLGLYLVKTQVESFGGKIEVESELDVGTTFKVYLPV
jgi:signal transduction histidine kinase